MFLTNAMLCDILKAQSSYQRFAKEAISMMNIIYIGCYRNRRIAL